MLFFSFLENQDLTKEENTITAITDSQLAVAPTKTTRINGRPKSIPIGTATKASRKGTNPIINTAIN